MSQSKRETCDIYQAGDSGKACDNRNYGTVPDSSSGAVATYVTAEQPNPTQNNQGYEDLAPSDDGGTAYGGTEESSQEGRNQGQNLDSGDDTGFPASPELTEDDIGDDRNRGHTGVRATINTNDAQGEESDAEDNQEHHTYDNRWSQTTEEDPGNHTYNNPEVDAYNPENHTYNSEVDAYNQETHTYNNPETDTYNNPENHTYKNPENDTHNREDHTYNNPESHTYNNTHNYNNPENDTHNNPKSQTHNNRWSEDHTCRNSPDSTDEVTSCRGQQKQGKRLIPNVIYEDSTQHEASGGGNNVEDDGKDDDCKRRNSLARLQLAVKNSRVFLVVTTAFITVVVVIALYFGITSIIPQRKPKATETQASPLFPDTPRTSTVAMDPVTSMESSVMAVDPVTSMATVEGHVHGSVMSMAPSTVAMDPVTSMAPSTVAMDSVTSMAPSTVAMDPGTSMVPSTVAMVMDVVTSTTQPDCASAWLAGYKTSGVYTIKPRAGERPLKVLCDMDTTGGGWTVFQRRFDGSVSFDKSWRDYRDGFGDVRGEFWLGLEAIHQIVSRETHDLRVELGDWQKREAYAQYSQFNLSNETSGYKLGLGVYSGTAGDGFGLFQKYSMFGSETPLDHHKGHTFKVRKPRNGWWYSIGHAISNLNGPYRNASVPTGLAGTRRGGNIEWGVRTKAISSVCKSIASQSGMSLTQREAFSTRVYQEVEPGKARGNRNYRTVPDLRGEAGLTYETAVQPSRAQHDQGRCQVLYRSGVLGTTRCGAEDVSQLASRNQEQGLDLGDDAGFETTPKLIEAGIESKMKLHPKKCRVMHFCFARIPPTLPSVQIDGHVLQTVLIAKLLGVWIQTDLKWDTQVNHMSTQGSKRLFILKRLKQFNLPTTDMTTVYTTYVRPVLEYAAPVWSSGLTNKQSSQIESIQRRACRIILGKGYTSYADACVQLGLQPLRTRREQLCLRFGKKLLNRDHINQGHHNAGAWTATSDAQDEENNEEDNPENHTFNNQRSEGEPKNHTCDNRPLEDPENHTYNNEEDFPENRPDNQTSEAIEDEHTYEKGPDETEVLKPYRCQQDRVERMIPNRIYEQSTQHEASVSRNSVEDDNNDSEGRSFLARLQHVEKNARVLLVFTTVLITTIVVTAVFLAIISTFPPKATQPQSSSPSSFSGFITSLTVAMESVTSMAPSTVAMDPVKSMAPSTVAMDPMTSMAPSTVAMDPMTSMAPSTVAMDPMTSMAPSTVAMDPMTSMAPSTVAMDPVKSMVCSTVTMAMDVVTSTTQPDCASAWLAGYKTSGVYTIKPWDGERPLKVPCDMDTAGGGWTVLQRRFDGSVSFDKSWRDYRDGFGDVRGEFWLGLEAIHQIVSRETHDLRIVLGDFEGRKAYADYSNFSQGPRQFRFELGKRPRLRRTRLKFIPFPDGAGKNESL
ncbi:hypothetical protein Bbelb_094640 [Branchiostoma belcheri]|nr:hypothetical protein Bbelb_094640 [Branchiostoma belcheri]